MDSKLSYEECVKVYAEYQQKYIEYNKTYEELKEKINNKNKEIEEIKEKIEMYSYPESANRYTFIQKTITKRREYKATIEKSKEYAYNREVLKFEMKKIEKDNNINKSKLEEIKLELDKIKLQMDKVNLEIEERGKIINGYIDELIVEHEHLASVLNNIENVSNLSEADKDYTKKRIKDIIKETYKEKLFKSKKQYTGEICLPEEVTIGVEIECFNKLREI